MNHDTNGYKYKCYMMLHPLDIFQVAAFWNKPPNWSGPEAAFYQGFDTSDGLVSWEGTNQTCNVPLVSGKVIMKKIYHRGSNSPYYLLIWYFDFCWEEA